jgi:hypothetical protein
MMDGEKRIVTFVGKAGRKTANIIWIQELSMFKVECETEGLDSKIFKLFMDESKAQTYAMEYVWEKQYGTI